MDLVADVNTPNADRPHDPSRPRQGSRLTSPRRIDSLDVLRGFALAGMTLVHVSSHASAPRSLLDRILILLVDNLAVGRFFPLFSFLFGCTLILQTERLSGPARRTFFLRRFGSLLVLAIGIWIVAGENAILFFYGLAAFLMWPLLRLAPRTLATMSLLLLLLAGCYRPCLEWLQQRQIAAALADAGEPSDRAAVEREAVREHQRLHTLNPQENGVSRTGSIADVMHGRAVWLSARIRRGTFWDIGDILAAILAGILVFPLGILQDPVAHRGRLRTFALTALTVGLFLGVGARFAERSADASGGLPLALLAGVLIRLAGNVLSAAYTALVLLALTDRRWLRPMLALRWPGRMALTCFIVHLACIGWLFDGYGLNLEHALSPTLAVAVACTVMIGLGLISRGWLSVFAQGPFEWLWRQLTGKPPRQPLTSVAAG